MCLLLHLHLIHRLLNARKPAWMLQPRAAHAAGAQVDVTFAPFLERIAASIAYYKGFMVRGEVSQTNIPWAAPVWVVGWVNCVSGLRYEWLEVW